jgi:hypothetical protein
VTITMRDDLEIEICFVVENTRGGICGDPYGQIWSVSRTGLEIEICSSIRYS